MSFLRRILSCGAVTFVCVGALGGFAGCSTVKETGRVQVMMSDSSSKVRESALAFNELKRRGDVVTGGSQAASVRRVGDRLVTAVGSRRNVEWEFVVFSDSDPNAFSLPGGKIGVNTGIFKLARNDGELAAVLGHEMAHVTARHGEEGQSQDIIAEVAGTAVDIGLAAADVPVELGDVFDAGAKVGVLLPYSRLHEYEADKIGMLYMAKAGYDPHDAIVFWQRMKAWSAQNGESGGPSFLRTHPLDQGRIQKLEAFLPKAMQEYEAARGRN